MTTAVITININKVFIGINCLSCDPDLCKSLTTKIMQCMVYLDLMCWLISGADQGFLEKGFICIKGSRFADFIYFFF